MNVLLQRIFPSRPRYERIPAFAEEATTAAQLSTTEISVPPSKTPRKSNQTLVVATVLVLALASSWWFMRPPAHHHQTIPTLLRIVEGNDDGKSPPQFVNSLDNPLYRQIMAHSEADHDDNRVVIFHYPSEEKGTQLDVDETEITVRGPLTLSWTATTTDEENDDVLLLHCLPHYQKGKNDTVLLMDKNRQKEESFHQHVTLAVRNILDVATLPQVGRSSTNAHNNNNNNSSWYFASFPILRHKACQFLWVRNLQQQDKRPVVKTASPIVTIHQTHEKPTAIHWAPTYQDYSDDTTSLTVQFVTGHPVDKGYAPIVQYYEIGGTTVEYDDDTGYQKAVVVAGTTDTYRAHDLCGSPANLTMPGAFQDPGALHTITVDELRPDAHYRYRVALTQASMTTLKEEPGDEEGIVWSESYILTTLPALGASNFTFLMYGDQGCPPGGWEQGTSWMQGLAARETDIRAIHHVGDLSYGNAAAHIWEEWLAMLQPAAVSIPYTVAVGNHEYCYSETWKPGLDPSLPQDDMSTNSYSPTWGNMGDDSNGECGVPVAKRFRMPSSDTSNGVFWYSLNMGSVHTTVISSEHDLTVGSPQREWLEADLASVDRSTTPWVVVEAHRPMYEAEMTWKNNLVGIAFRREFEDLLREHSVDLYLSGHYHTYFRTCDGLYKGKCNQGGPMHVTVGSAGAALDHLPLYRNGWTEKSLPDANGYLRLNVHTAQGLLLEFVQVGGPDDDYGGEILDRVWIRRDR